jgi:hypothetical protein
MELVFQRGLTAFPQDINKIIIFSLIFLIIWPVI